MQMSEPTGTLVLYYVPWCTHSMALMPKWDRLEQQYGGLPKLLTFRKVNCMQNPEDAANMNIAAYPTIMLFRNGERLFYDGPQTEFGIERFLYGDAVIQRRPAELADRDWAYKLFKLSVEPYVRALAGEWPEPEQSEFFDEGFLRKPIQIITKCGRAIGFYGIFVEDTRVTIQRMYIDPDFRGAGLGTMIVNEALQVANQERKPLETEVLVGNPAIDFYFKVGFHVVGSKNHGWVQQYVIRHRDTECYLIQNAI